MDKFSLKNFERPKKCQSCHVKNNMVNDYCQYLSNITKYNIATLFNFEIGEIIKQSPEDGLNHPEAEKRYAFLLEIHEKLSELYP